MAGIFNLFSDDSETREWKPISTLLSDFETWPSTEATQEAPCAKFFSEQLVYWSMRNIAAAYATMHFLICGMTGSGKSTVIKLFLQSIAPRFRPERTARPEQLIIYDQKGDMIPFLAALGHKPTDDHVYIFNPYDLRSVYWNVAEALQEPMMARHFATLIVPEEKGSNAPYFPDGARELVYAVILGLNAVAGARWTLRDLLCALDSEEHVKAVTAHHPRAKRLAQRLYKDEKHFPGLLSTLGTKLGRFEQVAALWSSNPNQRPFSITDFLAKPGVLILSSDPVLRESLWPITAMLLKALTNEILRRPDTRSPRHWFMFDEFRSMERVECVHDLVNLGRSKGVSTMIGIQSLEQLQEVYSEVECEDIVSQCANKVFLRAGGPKTAEWAERLFGKVRYVEYSTSESWNKDGSSRTISYSIQERSLFLSSMFLGMPFPERHGCYCAICDVPSQNAAIVVGRRFEEVLSWSIPPANIPAVQPRRDSKSQTLEPWTNEEEERFCKPQDTAKESHKKSGLPTRKQQNLNLDQNQ